MNCPLLVERDHQSVTVGWTPVPNAQSYHLQLAESGGDEETPEDKWTTLSESLKQTIVRKKNLSEGIPYRFRIRWRAEGDSWGPFSPASQPCFVVSSDHALMEAPTLLSKDGSSITVEWAKVPAAEGYRLRIRKDTEIEWTHLPSTIKNCTAKKKNLTPGQYYFSVMPVMASEDTLWGYSSSSAPLSVAQLAPYFAKLFPRTLLVGGSDSQSAPTADVLAGKTVAIYFSAHWCGPCRNFTPRLLALYQEAKAAGRNFEVVFCSADHDEDSFKEYYSSMKWTAVDYTEDERERIQGLFSVNGIPKLTVLSPSGRVVADNAAGQPLSLATVDSWLSMK